MTTGTSATSAVKVFFDGTHRVRRPEETWERMRPKLARFGITRIADVTGLDTIGIPVAIAVRPLARSLSVSQGKGQTLLLAKVSAMMESVELWHAEYGTLAMTHSGTSAKELRLSYRVADLAEAPGSLVTDRTPLEWVTGRGLLTGHTVPVPVNCVLLPSIDRQVWTPAGLVWSSNGLASGNTVHEATLHALYEIVERDALARLPAGSFGDEIDLRELDDPRGRALVDAVHRAGVELAVHHVPSRVDVPCFAARIWSADFSVTSVGFGAHLATDVALTRAITEAAQSRLTIIAGSRDDIEPLYHFVREGARNAAVPHGPGVAWADLPRPPVEPFVDVADELDWIGARVKVTVGHEPVVVDLGSDDDYAVVKVIVPGMATGLTRFRHA